MKRAALVLLLALIPAAASAARPVRVVVNDRPLDIAAYTARNRVMVPMRAIFEALGAHVLYDPRNHTVHAATQTHWLALPIGSRFATVDGRSEALDVPARVSAARTFVPIRFVSQSMGAIVGYDDRTDSVAIFQNVSVPVGLASAAPISPSAPSVIRRVPEPNQLLNGEYPTISATFARHGGPQITSTHMFVDGNDVSSLTSFDGETISYVPPDRLAAGWHNVFVEGTDAIGQRFDSSWSFDASGPQFGYDPYAGSNGFQFYANGPTTFYPGDFMNFVLIAPPGGYAALQLCNGWQYPFSNYSSGNFYQITQPVPFGYSYPYCNAVAIYTGWNGQQTYIPIPVIVAIYTQPAPQPVWAPAPQPGATPTFRRISPVGRRPEATPVPITARRIVPLPVKPLPVRIIPRPITPRPEPRPIILPHPPQPRASPGS
ncbi:MAG: stalk domain-containing protein [Candidatus Baltobacteraceae bacterium]